MICKPRRSGCGPTAGNTAFDPGRDDGSVAPPRLCATFVGLIAALTIGFVRGVSAEPADPDIGPMLERTVQQAENFRRQLQSVEYEAKMSIREWDGRGRLRGTARAHAIMRPGDARPVTFLSREVHGKVRLPEDKEDSQKEKEEETTLQEFAREHGIAERFEFKEAGVEEIAGERARRVTFKPKPNQPEKNTADRFLDTISGTAWVSDENKLVKFEMQLMRPFQLFWIFAVLKELSIQYELITPGEVLGHAKLKVLFALTTPVYSIRQLHDVDLDKFRRRQSIGAVTMAP